jgi:hypothetical protein
VFENGVLRRIFGPKRKEELHKLYASPYTIGVGKSSMMRWARHVERMGMMKCIQYFYWKACRERPLGRPEHKWEDNIRMDFREIGRKGVDRMHLVQDRVQWRAFVKTVMNLRVP